MNYMPYIFNVFVGPGGITDDAIRQVLEEKLALSAQFKSHKGGWIISAVGGFCSITPVAPDRELVRSIAKRAARRRVVASRHLEIVSGPNHYYWQYLPIYYDVIRAAFCIPGAYVVDREGTIFERIGDPAHDRMVAKDLFADHLDSLTDMLGDPEDYSVSDRDAIAKVASALLELLPPDVLQGEDLMQLIQALRHDEDEDGPAHELLQMLTLPEMDPAPLLEEALRDDVPHWTTMSLALRPSTVGSWPEALLRRLRGFVDADELWVRWAARLVLARAGDDGPLLAYLADPAEAQRITECMESGLLYHRLTDAEQAAYPFDEFFDFSFDNENRFGVLLAVTAGLCEQRHLVPDTVRPPDEDPWIEATAQWEALEEITRDEDLARHARSIRTTLARVLL